MIKNFSYVSKAFSNDKDVIMAAVQQSGWVLQCASYDLQNDNDLYFKLIKR
jgi:uncharacterized heparinase superfamily protein